MDTRRDAVIRAQIGQAFQLALVDHMQNMEDVFTVRSMELKEEMLRISAEGANRLMDRFQRQLQAADLLQPIDQVVHTFENQSQRQPDDAQVTNSKSHFPAASEDGQPASAMQSTPVKKPDESPASFTPAFQMRVPKFPRADNVLKEESEFERWKSYIEDNFAATFCMFVLRENHKVLEGEIPFPTHLIKPTVSSCLAYMKSNLDNKFQTFADSSSTPFELMTKLEKAVEPTSGKRFASLFAALMKFRFNSEKEDLARYNNRFNLQIQEMKAFKRDYILNDDLILLRYLESISLHLPGFYNDAMARKKKETLSLPDVQREAIDWWADENYRLERVAQAEKEDSQAVTYSKKTQPARLSGAMLAQPMPSTSNTPVGPCYKCGFWGHLKNQCDAEGPICYNCKRVGHVSMQCPERPTSNTMSARERARGRHTKPHNDTWQKHQVRDTPSERGRQLHINRQMKREPGDLRVQLTQRSRMSRSRTPIQRKINNRPQRHRSPNPTRPRYRSHSYASSRDSSNDRKPTKQGTAAMARESREGSSTSGISLQVDGDLY